ncbi:peroxisomal membrane protein PEX13 [Anoplophora glabripennis]|uniref:peroxisomal membrane protein PEX13 n=1 Tax=Anoplophora glabripennis TaxID=217634 RepID=UPI000875A4CF|nr:peroxisomal membrane protein PEX13 [Anoplophora glabripennis]
MASPLQTWEGNLQNSSQLIRNANVGPNVPNIGLRSAPVLPPRPSNSPLIGNTSYNSYMPYSGMGYGGYNSYGSSYGSYGMPYRSSLYNSYGSSYGGYNNLGMFGNVYPSVSGDDHERRFIQYAEESSRNTFASVESIVRAFNSIAMMLDNTFFAMTSSFRAVLSVAENFGRLRTMFGHIWYSINIFRFLNWLYRRMLRMMGFKVASSTASMAWKEAAHGVSPPSAGAPSGSSWPTIAFLGVLVSAPYIISRFLPKYEDKGDPSNWKSPGIRAKAVFDFIATAPNELTIQTNDVILLAPTYIQEEMSLKNTGWAFAVHKGKSGVVPLNYLVINKNKPITSNPEVTLPVPRPSSMKTHTKRVSFGENQIFENVDIDDYVLRKEPSVSSQTKKDENLESQTTKEKSGTHDIDVSKSVEKKENENVK